VIDELMPDPHRLERMDALDQISTAIYETPVLSAASGYIRFVDTKRLIALARSHRVRVKVLRRVGHFIPEGVPLLMVSKGDRIAYDGGAQFLGAFDLGPVRTLQQDVEFGVLQIVDIALKAISPAINDPSTAINCIDQLSRILIRCASREMPEITFYDPPGVPRVSIPWISLEGLLDSAFEQIRQYSTADVAVSLRLLRALNDIAATTPDPALRRALAERGKRIISGCSKKLAEEELRGLRERLATLEELSHNATTAPSGSLDRGE